MEEWVRGVSFVIAVIAGSSGCIIYALGNEDRGRDIVIFAIYLFMLRTV